MNKKYDGKLVQALKQRHKVEDYHGAPVLVKYLPDCDENGALQGLWPRVHRQHRCLSPV